MGMIFVASIISDTLAAIAIPLYLLLIAVCIKYRNQDPFRSSFFALTFSQGIADLMMIVILLTTLKPPLYYGIFIDVYLSYPLLFGRLQAFFTMALGFSQHMSLILIAFNRFTAVCVPVRHNSIWKRQITTIAIIAQWLIPLLIFSPIFTFDVRYIPLSNSSTLGLAWGNNNIVSFYYMISLAFIFAVVIVCALLYAIQFRTMWKQRRSTGVLSSQTRIELRLALMGAMIFAISSSYLFFLITSLVAPSIMQSALDLLWLYFLITDIMSSVNPFILIGMSKNVRQKCFDFLCGDCGSGHRGLEVSTRVRTITLMR